ncbi:MAG: energy transducer TonB [Paludibacteraceae bacterium]|nr:energy transducer TonB [Paludibacteraceae bacterium]
MTEKSKRHTIATIGTLLFLLLLFLLLWFVYLRVPQPVEDEGVEVAFGEVEEAGGYMPEESESVPLESEAAVPQQPSAPSDNDLMTQEDEESLALRRQREQEEKARQQAEAERLQRQKEEQARLEKERKAREAAEAAERAKQAEAIAKANQMGSLFGNGNSTSGSGDSQGGGQKGNPVGHGSSGGNDWSLAGRDLRGTLPQPSNNFNQEGKVIVEIRVNAAGTVVSATVKGGNVSDKQTQQIALEAAKKAKFTEGDHDQIGTITYIFKLN